jgi:hypothetical protein
LSATKINQGREVTELMMLASVLDDALVTDEVIPCRSDRTDSLEC